MIAEKKYRFSVVMPIYNVEEYLKEAIDSVIEQTIGFEENIQLILVNDGSPDNAASICNKYKALYPENIFYVEKENGGVSSARNKGMEFVSGEYVNFFDADDRWDPEAFEKVDDFFNREGEQVNIVSCRHRFFGKREGFTHPLDYKFKKRQVVDIEKQPSYIQMAVNAVFFNAEILKEERFDTRLRVSEDSIFVAKILLKEKKYGLLPEAVYHYRKRLSGDSALDISLDNKSWYLDTTEYCYKELFSFSKERFGKVIPYAQYLVMYDIQWRLKSQISDRLSQEERSLYVERLVDLLKEIDDKIIIGQRTSFIYKLYALKLKHGRDISGDLWLKGTSAMFGDTWLFNVREVHKLQVNIMKIVGDQLCMEGVTELGVLTPQYKLFCRDKNGGAYELKLFSVRTKDVKGLNGEVIFPGTGFKVAIPLTAGMKLQFVL